MYSLLHLVSITLDAQLQYLRGVFFSFFLQKVGTRFRVKGGVRIINPANVIIGNNVFINHDCDIEANKAPITIGDNVLIGMQVMILTLNHQFDSVQQPIASQAVRGNAVHIEDDVWIGARALILPGVTIHKGSVIAAGAVVTKNVPAWSVMAGVPARVIKMRK